MTASLESSRPIMAPSNRASVRLSQYSMAPSLTPTANTSDSSDRADLREIATGLDRMENKALADQRVVLSEEKTDTMSKLALGAKLERALDRRMSSQDAVMRPRGQSLNRKPEAAASSPTLTEEKGEKTSDE